VRSHFVSGRDIGDEVRYVLERRGQPRRPGVLLDKPGLLLNPWALRTTSSSVQLARSGGAFAPSPARAPAPAAPPPPPAASRSSPPSTSPPTPASTSCPPPRSCSPTSASTSAASSTIPRAQLGAAQHLRVLVVDPTQSSSADLPLPATELRPRDLRLRLALAHDGHFSEERRVEGVAAGSTLVVEDLRSGKLELVDTTARAHQVLLALGAPDHPARVRLRHPVAHPRRDHPPRPLQQVRLPRAPPVPVLPRPRILRPRRPPLPRHKRHKTFVDRWLLAEDLSAFRDPWAFHRLNALERVLLARRHPALAPAIARLLGDAVDLVPPDPERDARLVDTLLGATALEGGGVAAEASAAFAVMSLDESSDDDGEQARPPPRPSCANARRARRARRASTSSRPSPRWSDAAPPPGPPPRPAAPRRASAAAASTATPSPPTCSSAARPPRSSAPPTRPRSGPSPTGGTSAAPTPART
jgi:hypothetical protein